MADTEQAIFQSMYLALTIAGETARSKFDIDSTEFRVEFVRLLKDVAAGTATMIDSPFHAAHLQGDVHAKQNEAREVQMNQAQIFLEHLEQFLK